jgi:hypothetical protein
LIGISNENENVKAEVVLNELGRMVDYLIKNGY